MYLLYLLYLLLHICNAVANKCSNCKYFIGGKYQLNTNKNIQYTPEKCKLFTYFYVENKNIFKDYLDVNFCRKHEKYCGKDGNYFEPLSKQP
jgi:hypothetical protein